MNISPIYSGIRGMGGRAAVKLGMLERVVSSHVVLNVLLFSGVIDFYLRSHGPLALYILQELLCIKFMAITKAINPLPPKFFLEKPFNEYSDTLRIHFWIHPTRMKVCMCPALGITY